jgi:hypothetical protein
LYVFFLGVLDLWVAVWALVRLGLLANVEQVLEDQLLKILELNEDVFHLPPVVFFVDFAADDDRPPRGLL